MTSNITDEIEAYSLLNLEIDMLSIKNYSHLLLSDVVFFTEMGRKCTTLFNGQSCDSGYKGSKFKGIIFGFPPNTSEEGELERQR